MGPTPGITRVKIARLIAVAALLGGLAGAGAVTLLGGAPRGKSTSTVVHRTIAGGGTASLNAGAIFAAAADGVVSITVKGTTVAVPGAFPGQPQQQETTASGTGFIVDTSGHIVTASHVAIDAASITVTLANGKTRAARLLGYDNATDVAVLEIDPAGLRLQPLTLGKSSALTTGDAVAAIGDPFDFERSISTGIVSGVDRTIEAPNGFTVAHAVQTDAALNPGNSGGPLLDAKGRVVGVIDQIATSGSAQQSSGVGFAIPIDLVASELKQLEAGQTVKHPYVGVATSDAGSGQGAGVEAVTAGGPAAEAGVRVGDVITSIGGVKVTGSSELIGVIVEHEPGEKLTLVVTRDSKSISLSVTLGVQPATKSSA